MPEDVTGNVKFTLKIEDESAAIGGGAPIPPGAGGPPPSGGMPAPPRRERTREEREKEEEERRQRAKRLMPPGVTGLTPEQQQELKDRREAIRMQREAFELQKLQKNMSVEGKKDSSIMTTGMKFLAGYLGISALVKNSQVASTFLSGIFSVLGALVDIFLAPFIPILLPIMKGLASLIPLILPIMMQWGQNIGKFVEKIGVIFAGEGSIWGKIANTIALTVIKVGEFFQQLVWKALKWMFYDMPKQVIAEWWADIKKDFANFGKFAKEAWDLVVSLFKEALSHLPVIGRFFKEAAIEPPMQRPISPGASLDPASRNFITNQNVTIQQNITIQGNINSLSDWENAKAAMAGATLRIIDEDLWNRLR